MRNCVLALAIKMQFIKQLEAIKLAATNEAPNMVINIDGKDFEFKKGQTVLEIALEHEIYIPSLCYIDGLTPYGGCRLCELK